MGGVILPNAYHKRTSTVAQRPQSGRSAPYHLCTPCILRRLLAPALYHRTSTGGTGIRFNGEPKSKESPPKLFRENPGFSAVAARRGSALEMYPVGRKQGERGLASGASREGARSQNRFRTRQVGRQKCLSFVCLTQAVVRAALPRFVLQTPESTDTLRSM